MSSDEHLPSSSSSSLSRFGARKKGGSGKGAGSDEVRIMQKVLGNNGGEASSSSACLSALDATEWNVHHAIKIVKVRERETNMDFLKN